SAFSKRRPRMPESGWHATLCPYCGVGCGLLAEVRDGAVVRVKGDPHHPANFGDVCAKAVHLPPTLLAKDRLLQPHLRIRRGRPPSYEDIEHADCFFLIGTNTADCHPIIFKRLRKRKAAAPDDVCVIVADPRWTETADLADLHLALRPGSDIALLNGMLHVLG